MSFQEWFSAAYQAPFPLEQPLSLHPLDAKDWGDEMWGSENLIGKVPPPPMVPEFREDLGEYVLSGRWGRGSNSYALYFIEKRAQHRVFFRLLSAGAYVSEAALAASALAFLRGYQTWRASFGSKLTRSSLIHNMGQSQVELAVGDAPFTFQSVQDGAAFWAALTAAMPA